MKPKQALFSSLLILGILSSCGLPTPSQESPTAEPTFTTAAPQPTGTAAPTQTKTAAPTEPHILYSVADGTLPMANTFTVPRGAGLIGIESRTTTIIGLLSLESRYFSGTPFSWSPDGMRFVFVSTRSGNADLYVMGVSDSIPTRLTTSGENGNPAWSPNGEWIAFTSTRDDETNIYLTRPDGTETACLTCEIPGSETSPAWSPDSGSLAYAVPDQPAPIYIIQVASGEARAVSSPELRSAAPAFSPDGQWFVFECEQSICRNDIHGLTLSMLPYNPAPATQPRISPDGKQIAFISNRDGNYELYVINLDTSEALRLTTTPYSEMHPAWSPDGQWIAFASAIVFQETYTNFDIFIIRPDGRDMQPLVQSPENEFSPLWSPQP